MYQKVRSRQLNLNAYLSWDILKDLAFKATFAYTWRQDRNEAFNNADTYWGDPRYSAKHSMVILVLGSGMDGLMNIR